MEVNRWQHFTYTYDGANGRFYKDGALLAGPKAQALPNPWAGGFRLGEGTSDTIDGFIDEVRVRNVASSADWLAAQQLSMTDSFIGFSPEMGRCNLRSIGTASDTTAGTVTATNGSRTVTGSGTSWLAANRGRGDRIQIDGADYTILSVTSDTQLTLASVFTGATGSGKTYLISRQFPTLQAWENCISGVPATCTFFPVPSASLVADNRSEIGIAYDDSVFTSGVSISGSTTDSAHAITLTADAGNRHYGIAGAGALVDIGGSSTPAIGITDEFVTVEWLEITGGTGGADGIEFSSISNANFATVRYNLIHDMPGDGVRLTDPSQITDIYNNFIYEVSRGIIFSGPTTQSRISNNTVFSCNHATQPSGILGNLGPYPGVTLKNNVAHSNTNADFDIPGLAADSSNNLSGDATALSHSPNGGSPNGIQEPPWQISSSSPRRPARRIFTFNPGAPQRIRRRISAASFAPTSTVACAPHRGTSAPTTSGRRPR